MFIGLHSPSSAIDLYNPEQSAITTVPSCQKPHNNPSVSNIGYSALACWCIRIKNLPDSASPLYRLNCHNEQRGSYQITVDVMITDNPPRIQMTYTDIIIIYVQDAPTLPPNLNVDIRKVYCPSWWRFVLSVCYHCITLSLAYHQQCAAQYTQLSLPSTCFIRDLYVR